MENTLENILEDIKAGKAQLIDVREKNEWDQTHLDLAKLVPLSQLRSGIYPPDDIDPEKKTYIHCRSGARVNTANPLLRAMGFTNVISLKQGVGELIANGFKQA